jgi:hypothetical protein
MSTRRDILARSAPRTLFALALLSSLAACDTGLRPGSESLLDGISAQPPPSELAAMALDPYDANRRAVGTLGLANQSFAREPIYIKLFVDNSSDADPVVRASAIRGLAIHGSPDHVPILVKALKDSDTQVRLEAARGLQRLHSSVAVDALLTAMREPDSREIAGGESEPVVRAEAAGALAQYREPRVLQSLNAGLDDNDLAVNRACLASLRTLTGQDFALDRQAWLSWVKSTNTPFIAGSPYLYPVFTRTRRFYEYFPFVLPPPNEVQSTPTGLPRS